jgi:hypothetical protein
MTIEYISLIIGILVGLGFGIVIGLFLGLYIYGSINRKMNDNITFLWNKVKSFLKIKP